VILTASSANIALRDRPVTSASRVMPIIETG
jgi:hypothetical protein